MKASEVVTKIQELIESHGDLECECCDDWGHIRSLDGITLNTRAFSFVHVEDEVEEEEEDDEYEEDYDIEDDDEDYDYDEEDDE